MDIYTYLLDRNGFKTHTEAYFVFYQVDKTGGVSKCLAVHRIAQSYQGRQKLGSQCFEQAVVVARQDTPPEVILPCPHCVYVQQAW